MISVAGKLLPFFREHPWRLCLIILLGLLASLAEGIGISLFIPFLENLEQTEAIGEGIWIVEFLEGLFASVPPQYRLAVIAGSIFASIFIKAGLSFAHQVMFHSLDARFIHDLRSLIVRQLLTVPFGYYAHARTGQLVNTLSNETWRSSEALAELVNFVSKACALLVYAGILLLISWFFTAIAFCVVAVIWLCTRWVSARADIQGREATAASSDAMRRQIEVVEGMKTIRANTREAYEQSRFDSVSRRAAEAIRKVSITRDWVTPLFEVLAAAFLVSFLYLGIRQGVPISVMLVFLLALYRIQPLAKTLEESRVHIISLGGAVDAVCDLLESTASPVEAVATRPFQGLNRELRFENVSFRYEKASEPALSDVSFRIPATKTVALVGRSGSGKSTVLNLLTRFYEPEVGRITVDDAQLGDFSIASWRERIALVGQDTYIFNGTVLDNIAYGRPDAEFEDIVAAAETAEADGFIRALSKGYETELGERGFTLSSGQRQRIALARAILRDPEILILDEATNALDSISEEAIRIALDRIRSRRTVLVVAHRLSTVKHADLVVVLDEGRVVEQGTYQQLADRDGVFGRLYQKELRP